MDTGDQFFDFAWKQVTFGDTGVYAIPQDTGPMAMFYRKDLFEKYGVEVPKTWRSSQPSPRQYTNRIPRSRSPIFRSATPAGSLA